MAPVSIEGCTFYVAIYLFPSFLRALEYFIATDTKRWGMIDSMAIKQGKGKKCTGVGDKNLHPVRVVRGLVSIRPVIDNRSPKHPAKPANGSGRWKVAERSAAALRRDRDGGFQQGLGSRNVPRCRDLALQGLRRTGTPRGKSGEGSFRCLLCRSYRPSWKFPRESGAVPIQPF